ncbi:hypothetical protein EG870_16020, partial [Enterococcus faecalis]
MTRGDVRRRRQLTDPILVQSKLWPEDRWGENR